MGWTTYSDIGTVYELSAVYDDVLKKNSVFTDYAVMVANQILLDLGIKAYATYGKWGARLEPAVNPELSKQEIEAVATKIKAHHSWKALTESTYVFTYGNTPDEIYEYQNQAKEKAEATAKTAHEFFMGLIGANKPLKIEAPQACLDCMENLAKTVSECRKCTSGPQIISPKVEVS